MYFQTFILMLEQGRRQHAVYLKNLAQIQAVSICNSKYYESLVSVFDRIISENQESELPERPENPFKAPVLKAESMEAKNAVMGLCHIIKRGH